jgi:hypothetical protein
MKQTIGPILAAFASADSGTLEGLPLSPEVYLPECVEAASLAFEEFCAVRVTPGKASQGLSLVVHLAHRESSAQIVGEFLNYLLAVSAKRLRCVQS